MKIMKTVEAVKDKIIVEVLSKDEKTDGGLFVPEGSKLEPQFYGEVLSVGSEVEGISVGDVLVFHERAGMDMVVEKRNLKCIKHDEIYGILRQEEE